MVGIVVLLNYPSFLLVGTYDQYHNLNGQSREAMESAWSNAYGFSVGWIVVMAYFATSFVYLVKTIRGENSP